MRRAPTLSFHFLAQLETRRARVLRSHARSPRTDPAPLSRQCVAGDLLIPMFVQALVVYLVMTVKTSA